MPITKARAEWIENVRSVAVNARSQSVVCDLGKPSGGTDAGPTAFELSLMALADCAVTIFADVAKNSKIQLTKMTAEVEAEKASDNPRPTNVTLKVRIAGKARKNLLEAAWRRTEAACPVMEVFRNPIPVSVAVEIVSEE